MTVQVSDRLSQLYVGNGVNTRFDFMFRAYEQEDETGIGVRVKVGNDFEFIEESEYAVTFNPDNMGGYVTFVDPPSPETFFYIAGKTPVDQLLDITNYDNFYPDAIERALDKLTAILQEWKHLVDFETQARILADIDYDQLAIQREADLKAYIDGIASSITGQPVLGLPSKFVVDGTETQEQINDKSVRVLKSVVDLLSYTARVEGQAVFVKEFDSFYEYDPTNTSPISLNGWVLQHRGIISTRQLNIQNGADISALLSYADSNKLFIELPLGYQFTSTVFKQSVIVGEGSVKYIYDYLANDNTEHVTPKTASPYPQKGKNTNYGWYDVVQARSNWEHGAGYSLLVNSDTRPQVCGFRTKQQQKGYASVDIVGFYTHVSSPKVETLANCTFTANSVTSASITEDLDIKPGDFIVTEWDAAIGKPWRSEVVSIDLATNTIYVTWWLHESGNGEGTPPNGLTCYTPYANGLWGHNTNVFLMNNDKAETIVGYELGVYTEKTRANFNRIDGFYAVNLTSQVARAQDAFKTGGNWDNALGAYNCTTGVFTDGSTNFGMDFTSVKSDANSSAVIMRNPTVRGNLVRSVAGIDLLFNIDSKGVQSHLKLGYVVDSASRTHNGLNPSLLIGANADGNHTTTLNTARMYAGHILEFKQLQNVDWSIVAGSNTYVLNTAGTIDYLKLLFDGTNFLKIFAAKSL
ncbi:hypothetical protein OHV31_00440 [Acinetobacter baumannii]|nr:hypothetical protein [Acinetobacter baumannii]